MGSYGIDTLWEWRTVCYWTWPSRNSECSHRKIAIHSEFLPLIFFARASRGLLKWPQKCGIRQNYRKKEMIERIEILLKGCRISFFYNSPFPIRVLKKWWRFYPLTFGHFRVFSIPLWGGLFHVSIIHATDATPVFWVIPAKCPQSPIVSDTDVFQKIFGDIIQRLPTTINFCWTVAEN